MQLDGPRGATRSFDAAEFKNFRHGYAGTIYRGQGRTLDQTFLYHSQHWRSAASYVALTRHRDKAELFAATNTARDVTELARQMARVDDRRAASLFYVQPQHTGYASGREGPQPMSDTTSEDSARRTTNARRQRRTEPAKPQVLPEEEADRLFRGAADRLAEQAEELRRERRRLVEHQEQIDAYTAEQQRLAEEERKRQAQIEAEAREGEIKDARNRYGQALGAHYDIRDPYASLARAAMAEYGSFMRDREKLARDIAQESDPRRRKMLELRRDIEAADYMAITSRRLAAQSEVIVGRSDTEEAVRQRTRAADFEAQARELRQQYREQAIEQRLVTEPEATAPSEPSRDEAAPRQRTTRSTRGRTAEVEEEKQAEAGESDRRGEGRRRAQRGEQSRETERKRERGREPDLER